MLKKILYGIIVIAVIVILAIMWTDNKKDENTIVTPPVNTSEQTTNPTINDELNNVKVDSGIDDDLKSMDTDIQTL